MPFTLGQRWISDTESELGLGTVVAMDARTVTLLFSSTGENRLYARSDSPVTRVMFNPGDTITSHEGWQLHVDEVKEENGLLAYIGTRLDTEETGVTLREVLLDSKLVFSKPQDRLFAGQIDRMDRFALRYRARKFQSEQYRMPWSGLRGQRTSLIPHQLNIAHDVGRRGRNQKQIRAFGQRDVLDLPRLRAVKRIHRNGMTGERFKRQRRNKTACVLRHHNKNVDAPLLQQAQQLTCLINRNASGYAEDNAGFLRLT